ncbi:hypothetical protein MCOR29_008988 [Pyricularia oryzae]|uniref:Cytochrome P450 n=1 Tax=Pyricularia grisea TaxID=148305 RepID=A0ABQ8NBF5_PYRGI|nr:hypothetical protein MCOR33_008463 [Pyricularia grisea]KAI6309286.1 hypothetical protein MCOR29_008988 [Pyricularia oryzae]KAI6324163.1 hypothetical protein MCOR30_007160 [Pyricularia oryzae]KAI6485458.1 hypothetical protein MCOR11_009671 [Pyricularia oryzae]KAI6520870.1 hypothetical protein MCOR10_006188 [Pyricularia oryzae]
MGVQDFANLLLGGRFSGSVTTAALLLFLALVLVVSGVRSIRSISARRTFIAENNCKPAPAWPQKDPFLALDFIQKGLANFRQKKFLDGWTKYYEDLGPTFTTKAAGMLYINTIDPENIKTVLATRFRDFSLAERVEIMGPLLGRGIFVTDGDEWAHSRALLRPNFAKEQVADLGMIDRHFSDLMALLRPHAADGTTVALQPLLMRMTMDTATEFLFGQSTRTLSVEQADSAGNAFSRAFQFSLNEMAHLFRLGPFRILRRQSRELKDSHDICRAYVDGFVDEAWAWKQGGKTDGRTNFLRELVESTDNKQKVRDELLNILIAGRDTVASVLGSLFRVLAQRPEIWAKVRAEVAQFEGELPRYEQLRDLKYAKYCINEALRLWPAVPMNGRLAVRDTVLPRGGGPNGDEPVYVPKGSLVNYSVYSMHRRTDFYGADAEEFRPERWEGKIQGWQYLPFNGGPRICLGQQYALTEMLVVLVRFAQEFSHIESRESTPWQEELHLTVQPANGVQVALTAAKTA